jgi:hypothetical protein
LNNFETNDDYGMDYYSQAIDEISKSPREWEDALK